MAPLDFSKNILLKCEIVEKNLSFEVIDLAGPCINIFFKAKLILKH